MLPSINLIVQGLNPGKAIAEIKKLLAGIADKGQPGLKVNSENKFSQAPDFSAKNPVLSVEN